MRYAKAIAAAGGVAVVELQQQLPGDAIWTNEWVTGALAVLTVFGVYRVENKPSA